MGSERAPERWPGSCTLLSGGTAQKAATLEDVARVLLLFRGITTDPVHANDQINTLTRAVLVTANHSAKVLLGLFSNQEVLEACIDGELFTGDDEYAFSHQYLFDGLKALAETTDLLIEGFDVSSQDTHVSGDVEKSTLVDPDGC